jgi:hypothetical protein
MLCGWCVTAQSAQQVSFPCYATATTTLNVRQGPRQSAKRIGKLSPGDRVIVERMANDKWGQIQYSRYNLTAYIHMDYVRLSPIPAPSPASTSVSPSSSSWFEGESLLIILFKVALYIILIYFVLCILAFMIHVVVECSTIVVNLLYYGAILVNIPFRILNWLQRFLAKPWRIYIKRNRFSDSTNRALRLASRILKVPLYVALFPLRFVLACYYNLVIHCSYEWINYLLEVVNPERYEEGGDDWWTWTYMLPVRVVKYLCWHGTLTIVESLIWTAVDTFLPALTLYHGTDDEAAQYILSSPDRSGLNGWGVSHWMVGDGNFAGNGIYFAPMFSTAHHYGLSRRVQSRFTKEEVIILCRVTLGRTLDLGLAPWRVSSACGYSDATIATQWGLNHGYVTGEWWRADKGWWEYCMYDWQNRYNYSWRIRPIYAMPQDGKLIQRIPGGMHHWLFRRVVWEDILQSLEELPENLSKWWRG